MRRASVVVIVGMFTACHAGAFAEDWWETIKVSGDLRYRHELIDDSTKSEDRTRHRARARLALTAKPREDVEIGLRLASGSADPVSTNQSLDGGFSSKGINVDRAYFKWTPDLGSDNTEVRVTGGKMGVPFLKPGKSDLLWDGDLSPEGLAVNFDRKTGRFGFFAGAGLFWVEERSEDDDSLLSGGQLGLKYKADAFSITGGVGYFVFGEAEGREAFFNSEDGFGNTTTTAGTDELYDFEYEEFEAFLEVGFKVADVPVKVFVDFVKNGDPGGEDTGFLAGFEVGKGKKPGQIKFKYDYRKLEADAVIGAFTDSDSGGGGTDVQGHRISLAVPMTDSSSFGVTYFINEMGIGDGGDEDDYRRLQVDFKFKF